MILTNNEIEIGHETRNILISCKNVANYNKFINVVIFFYQKVIEDSLKRLPMYNLYKEFRFVFPKIVFIIKSLNCGNKKQDILNELSQIKFSFSNSEKIELLTDVYVLEFWNYIYELKNFIFKNIAELVLTVLCLPHGNAGVEKIFFIMA